MAFGRKQPAWLFPLLAVALAVVFVFSLRFGAISISFEEMRGAWLATFNGSELSLQERIFMNIRFPRALAAVGVGACLAVSGVLMQGLFRNPIVEPGLIGTSAGSAFGASLYFVLGASLQFSAGIWTLPIAAALGGALATLLVFTLSGTGRSGKSAVVSLLLTGIAVNALFLSGVGFLSYIARDPQARSITFWNLGTLSGASWTAVVVIFLVAMICLYAGWKQAKGLNALMMGEQEAEVLGIRVSSLQWTVMTLNVLLVAAATAFTGVISFVGLIVPHLLRLTGCTDNRYLLWGSALLGGILLSMADLVARLWLAPAELPIGIVTSMVGVPVFIILLRKNRDYLP